MNKIKEKELPVVWRRRYKGISLIEVLIATLIFVATLVGVLEAYVYSVYLSQLNRDITIALNNARSIMETMRSTPMNSLVTRFPDGVADGPAGVYQSYVGGYTLSGERITVAYTDIAQIPLEAVVTVQWGDMRFVQRTVALTTMRSQ